MTAPATLNTVQRIVCYAYEDAGIVQEGDSPNSEQIAKGIVRLTDLINFEQTQGLKLWKQFDQSVTLVAAQGDYTMMPSGDVNITRPLRVLQGYYQDSSSNRRPIYPLSADEWLRLATVSQQGQVSQFWVEKLVDRLKVHFWQIPDTNAATGTAHLFIQQQIIGPVLLTDTMDFPQETMIFLRWALADDLATGQPQAIMDRCMLKAETYRKALEDWDVEDTETRIAPDMRFYQGSSFN